MTQLLPAQITTITDLTEPFLRIENERLTLIDTVFIGAASKPDIDTTGAPHEFTRRLIFRLRDYGEIEPGKPALWALLEAIRPQVGVDKQAQIDALKDAIFAAAAPTAAYVIVAEGGQSIFMSYAHEDRELVERLRADLQAADFNLWIDHKGLKVGQKNWEREIRQALAAADGVIYIGSPEAADSNFVGAEIAIAEEKKKPIFTVWAAGEAWTDSAPLSLVKAQYADLRGAAYAAGVAELIASLRGVDGAAGRIEPVQPETPPPPAPDFEPHNPYKGLRAFEAADRGRFFGREAFVGDLLALLRADPRFLAVIGASGSGKSSVVMAGLLPRLADGQAIPGSGDWRLLNPLKPGKIPLEHLTDQLGLYLPQLLPSDIRRELDHESARGLLRLARRITSSRLVLYIDQFEELFTLTEDDTERRQFIDLITTAANEPDSPLTLLLTMRADFYDRPLAYGELGDLISRRSASILPLTITELFDAVRKPAALPDAQLVFDDGLVEELVFAVSDQAGALPLLQFALEKLFERRDSQRLTWQAYTDLGGVKGALANYAESVYDDLDEDGQQLARALFLRLIEPGASEQDTTRRRAALSELVYADAEATAAMQRVTETFVAARLLTEDRFGDEETVEVSHEALIREWARLQNWLHDAREDVTLMKRIAADADDWARTGRDEALVYGERRLADAQRWAERGQPSQLEAAFIAAGAAKAERLAQQERDRQAERLRLMEGIAAAESARATRARRAAVIAGLIGLVAVVAFVIAAVFAERTASQVAFTGLEINRFSTLNAGNVLVPLQTQTPGIFQPTLTAIAALNQWTPVVQDFGTIPMVEVPAGCFFMGSTLSSNEQPIVQQCFDAAFWIGQTEVTNAQYQAFIDAGGYDDQSLWTADGWTWRNDTSTNDGVHTEPEYWTDSRYNAPDQPVVGVSWYEAMAYATWLGTKPDCQFDLPTEREWEYTARGPDSRVYPWGNTWDSAKAITYELNMNAPAPVNRDGSQSGASWVGAQDMSGNVWEWMKSLYQDYPYRAGDGREIISSSGFRVVRGGSWHIGQYAARAAYRDFNFPSNRNFSIGFRVVCRPPSPGQQP